MIDFKETFFLISLKDSFKTSMTLVEYYDLVLHPMNIKTTFLNANIDQTIHIVQPGNFVLGTQIIGFAN